MPLNPVLIPVTQHNSHDCKGFSFVLQTDTLWQTLYEIMEQHPRRDDIVIAFTNQRDIEIFHHLFVTPLATSLPC